MKTTLEVVTPDMALTYLKANTENRPLRHGWVETLAGMMRRGQWQTTHQGIAFDEKGRLVDGQHRLHAIREFGQSVQILVSRGLPDNVYRSVDAGRTRTLGDRLKLMTDPYVNRMACSIVRSYVVATTNAKQASQVDLVDNCFLSMSDEFSEVAERFTKKVIGLTRSDIGAAIVCYMSADASKAREFMDGYLTGEDLRAGAPEKMLREALFTKRLTPGRIHEAYWKTIFCTRAHAEGRTLSAVQPATIDWRKNRYDRLHYEKTRISQKGAETKKRDDILRAAGPVNGRRVTA